MAAATIGTDTAGTPVIVAVSVLVAPTDWTDARAAKEKREYV